MEKGEKQGEKEQKEKATLSEKLTDEWLIGFCVWLKNGFFFIETSDVYRDINLKKKIMFSGGIHSVTLPLIGRAFLTGLPQ